MRIRDQRKRSVVIPAQAGIQHLLKSLDPRLRGDDEPWVRGMTSAGTSAGMRMPVWPRTPRES